MTGDGQRAEKKCVQAGVRVIMRVKSTRFPSTGMHLGRRCFDFQGYELGITYAIYSTTYSGVPPQQLEQL